MLLGSSIFPSQVCIGDQSVPLGTIVRRVFKQSGLSVAEWNDLSELERDSGILLTIHTMKSERAIAPRTSFHVEPGRPELCTCAAQVRGTTPQRIGKNPCAVHDHDRSLYVPHEDLPTK